MVLLVKKIIIYLNLNVYRLSAYNDTNKLMNIKKRKIIFINIIFILKYYEYIIIIYNSFYYE